jgi:hypothetical protein
VTVNSSLFSCTRIASYSSRYKQVARGLQSQSVATLQPLLLWVFLGRTIYCSAAYSRCVLFFDLVTTVKVIHGFMALGS